MIISRFSCRAILIDGIKRQQWCCFSSLNFDRLEKRRQLPPDKNFNRTLFGATPTGLLNKQPKIKPLSNGKNSGSRMYFLNDYIFIFSSIQIEFYGAFGQ